MLWPGLLSPVIQLAYFNEHDDVVALTSDVGEASLSARERTWCSLKRLKGVALKHHLIDGVNVGSTTLLAGNVVQHLRYQKQHGVK